MRKQSGSGIMVGGKTLEEFLYEQEEKERIKNVDAILNSQIKKHAVHVKGKGSPEETRRVLRRVVRLTPKQIRKEYGIMGASSFDDLIEHYGHKLEAAVYGDDTERGGWLARNATVECSDCHVVLIDFDRIPEDRRDEDEYCKFCDSINHLGDMHRHTGGYVCEECWDERLRCTE